MDAARWQRAKQLIADALARPPAERAAFLSSACQDEDLRHEIEVMLTSSEDDTAEDIRPPVVDRDEPAGTSVADSSEAPAAFEFAPGDSAGPYVFTAPLGKGGGGEVYRARDRRLQRDVAIKVLRAKDAAEGARRVREARAAAQLNHRSIAAIYDVFDMAGRTYIVQEYVPGDTLADRMRHRTFPAADMMSTAVAVLTSPLPDLPRSVPRRLRAIIARCLERTPEDRYASAAELRAALVAAQVSRWKLVVGSVLFRRP